MIRRRDLVGCMAFGTVAVATASSVSIARAALRTAPDGQGLILDRIPSAILGWHAEPSRDDMVDPVVTDVAFAQALQMYDHIVGRDYAGPGLPRIMLNASYKRMIEQEQKFHWPEICYSTQGFDVTKLAPQSVTVGGHHIGVQRFMGRRNERNELVHYIMRIGDYPSSGSFEVRRAIFFSNLNFQIPDGVMLRVSTLLAETGPRAIAAGDQYLRAFLQATLSIGNAPLFNLLNGRD